MSKMLLPILMMQNNNIYPKKFCYKEKRQDVFMNIGVFFYKYDHDYYKNRKSNTDVGIIYSKIDESILKHKQHKDREHEIKTFFGMVKHFSKDRTIKFGYHQKKDYIELINKLCNEFTPLKI